MSKDNRLEIVGRLTRDADPIGTKGLRFSIAYNQEWTTKDGKHEKKTDFFNCVAWTQAMIEYMKKGRLIRIEGRIEQNKYLKDGKEVANVQIVAENITILSQQEPRQSELVGDGFNDDIPF
jgi:single-strand DNA-binding protein